MDGPMSVLPLLLAASLSLGSAQPSGRPTENWVFRSVLDQRPRMVTALLHPDLSVAYDATYGSLYKAWKGGVELAGAVYTTEHGPQPTAKGPAYWEPPTDRPVWTVRRGSAPLNTKVVYRGYRWDRNKTRGFTMLVDLVRSDNTKVTIEETPEAVGDADGRVGLERSFKVTGLGNDRLVLEGGAPRKSARRILSGNLTVTDRSFVFDGDGEARWVELFDPPTEVSLDHGDEHAMAQAARREQGLGMRIYAVGKQMTALPLLVPGQTANVNRLITGVDFHNDNFGYSGSPFLVHITGFLKIERAGTYTFRLTSDDGSVLWITDTKVLDHDGLHSATPKEGSIDLAPGELELRLEHFDSGGDAVLRLEWRKPGDTEFSLIPASAFATTAGEVRVTAPGMKNVLDPFAFNASGDKRPLEGVHPSFDLAPVRPEGFEPRVGGLDFLPDGRMVVCTWDPVGGVYVLDGFQGGGPATVKTIATGLAEPLGIKVVDGAIYVLQKQELTRLDDTNGDGIIDAYTAMANGWGVTPNFHEFAFGLLYKGGFFYATLATAIDPGGRSTRPQNPDRGKVVKISAKDGSYQMVARGLRTPNGIGFGPNGGIYITDNQGDWLPSSKVLLLQEGAFYGNRSVEPEAVAKLKETPPIVWLPQGEIGNSPSQPAPIEVGPYKGQLLHGDVTHGGLKRTFVERVDGFWQGTVFRFTQGLEAGVNRIAWGPDGALYVGGIGSTGNWGQEGKKRYGLERLAFNGKPTHEMLAVRAMTNGLEIEFTQPLPKDVGWDPTEYEVEQWRYEPTEEYGGPKVDQSALRVKSATVGGDRRKVFLEVEGMKPGHVVYVRLAAPFASESGQPIWSTEAWMTVNAIPRSRRGRVLKPPFNLDGQLSPAEVREGFVSMTLGDRLEQWANQDGGPYPSGWYAEKGELKFRPDGARGDIRTRAMYGDFDFRFEWRVGDAANSGVIYRSWDMTRPTWNTGPEYQILDDRRYFEGKLTKNSAGSNYDLEAPAFRATKPVGNWNQGRIVARGNKVEHWLNGYKIVEYEIGSPKWREQLAASKFKDMPGYATAKQGYIVLQDHGDPVSYRNLRIKRLD